MLRPEHIYSCNMGQCQSNITKRKGYYSISTNIADKLSAEPKRHSSTESLFYNLIKITHSDATPPYPHRAYIRAKHKRHLLAATNQNRLD